MALIFLVSLWLFLSLLVVGYSCKNAFNIRSTTVCMMDYRVCVCVCVCVWPAIEHVHCSLSAGTCLLLCFIEVCWLLVCLVCFAIVWLQLSRLYLFVYYVFPPNDFNTHTHTHTHHARTHAHTHTHTHTHSSPLQVRLGDILFFECQSESYSNIFYLVS